MEEEFLAKSKAEGLTDGTTVCIAIIQENRLWVANVGDSELVLCRKGEGIPLSEVHNPKKNKKEGERVEKEGGRIYHDRVGHPRLNPGFVNIAVSRSIGDAFFKAHEFTDGKPSGIIATPFVQEIELTENDDFCVLACDGVWDVLTAEDVARFVAGRLKTTGDIQKITEDLVQRAYDKGSTDNITALIITFKKF